jgi:hypothetical protein
MHTRTEHFKLARVLHVKTFLELIKASKTSVVTISSAVRFAMEIEQTLHGWMRIAMGCPRVSAGSAHRLRWRQGCIGIGGCGMDFGQQLPKGLFLWSFYLPAGCWRPLILLCYTDLLCKPFHCQT